MGHIHTPPIVVLLLHDVRSNLVSFVTHEKWQLSETPNSNCVFTHSAVKRCHSRSVIGKVSTSNTLLVEYSTFEQGFPLSQGSHFTLPQKPPLDTNQTKLPHEVGKKKKKMISSQFTEKFTKSMWNLALFSFSGV